MLCINFGSTFLRGNDKVKRNDAIAFGYYDKACTLGDDNSCDWVAKHKP